MAKRKVTAKGMDVLEARRYEPRFEDMIDWADGDPARLRRLLSIADDLLSGRRR